MNDQGQVAGPDFLKPYLETDNWIMFSPDDFQTLSNFCHIQRKGK